MDRLLRRFWRSKIDVLRAPWVDLARWRALRDDLRTRAVVAGGSTIRCSFPAAARDAAHPLR
jgi:hypothetical protein